MARFVVWRTSVTEARKLAKELFREHGRKNAKSTAQIRNRLNTGTKQFLENEQFAPTDRAAMRSDAGPQCLCRHEKRSGKAVRRFFAKFFVAVDIHDHMAKLM